MKMGKEIFRLEFENLLWVIFIMLSLLNIYGDLDDEKFLKTNNTSYKMESNYIFNFTLTVTLFIYLYFFIRNYKKYESIDDSQKDIYLVKLLGSAFLIAGIICLLYFQNQQNSFLGSPAI